MSGDIDGALPIPRSERLWDCPPAAETPMWVDKTLVDDVIRRSVAANVAREELFARTAAALGHGYAVITTFSADIPTTGHVYGVGYRTDYVATPLIPPMERFEFPSWAVFDAWRAREERKRG